MSLRQREEVQELLRPNGLTLCSSRSFRELDPRALDLKMVAPTYRSVAVASALSPRFVQVLTEAKRVATRFGSELNLIYVGEQNEETDAKFREVLGALGLRMDATVHYQKGDPASAILEVIAAQKIELIVAGALEKQVVLRSFVGNVARRLLREAPCSVMLFTKPKVEPTPLRKIVFISDQSEHAARALEQTYWLAEHERCECLYVVRVHTTFDEARARAAGEEQSSLAAEQHALEEWILGVGHTDVAIDARCIRGNTGFAASDFVQSVEADLLVVPAAKEPDPNAMLPAHIGWITEVIPCNLWVIR